MLFLQTGFRFIPAGNVAKSFVMIVVKAMEPYVLILTVALRTILIMTRFMQKISFVWRLFVAAALGLFLTTGVCYAASEVVGWRLNSSGQTTIPSGLSNVVAIATGYSHRLARTAQGGWSAVGGTITARRSSPALGPTRGDDSLPGAALRFDPSLPPRPWESVCSLDSASINTPLLDPTPNPSRTP